MAGFKNLETSTTYAIRGFFEYLYKLIPDEYRIHYINDEATDCYREFFDQELSFENRLHYKIAKLPFKERKTPWIAIMWNTDGLFPSDENYRRYDVKFAATDDESLPKKGKACLAKMPITLSVVSNSMTALMEFEEVYLLNVRPDDMALSTRHPILDEFSINIMNGAAPTNITKMPRSEGTLCYAMASVILQFPIVGVPKDQQIIRTIRADFRNYDTKEPMFDSKMIIIGGDITPEGPTEPDSSVTDLLYHSISEKITGFNDGQHGYIKTYKTIPLRHSDNYEVSVEVDPTINNLPDGSVDFSIMYNFNNSSISPANLQRLIDGGFIKHVGNNYYMSPRVSVNVPTEKYIIKLSHRPSEDQYGLYMGEFTYASYNTNGNPIDTKTTVCLEPNDEDLYVDYNTANPNEWHVAGIYTLNNSYIRVNGDILWELREEVDEKHIPTVED